jgi:DNA-binding transcriptional regulator LsrR (DeoR family)
MQNLDSEQVATLVQVAHLYYKDNLSQREIADKLGVSRSLIALYLQKAREQQIVRIEIINPQDSSAGLALELRNRAHIEDVIVVPHGHMTQELTRRAIAAAAAQYLDGQLEDGDTLGLGWGRTTARLVELLAPTRPRDIDVVPLLGESSYTSAYTQMNQLVLQTAQHFNGRPHFLLAPMMVGSKVLRDLLMEDMAVRSVAQKWDQLTIAVFGIGLVTPTSGMIVYIGEENLPTFRERGAVGDVCVHYFNAAGEFIDNELMHRLIGVSVQQLSTARCRVAVATGVEKAAAVMGALRTGLITALVVDAQLAQAVIDMLEPEEAGGANGATR